MSEFGQVSEMQQETLQILIAEFEARFLSQSPCVEAPLGA